MNSSIFHTEHSKFYQEWTDIIENFDLTEPVTGIYKVFSINENGERMKINRLISFDSDGIIYIGKSTNLGHRLGNLVNLLNNTTSTAKHPMGNRYQRIENLKKYFLVNRLRIEVEFCKNPRIREIDLIENYLQKHGEVPPLNNSH